MKRSTKKRVKRAARFVMARVSPKQRRARFAAEVKAYRRGGRVSARAAIAHARRVSEQRATRRRGSLAKQRERYLRQQAMSATGTRNGSKGGGGRQKRDSRGRFA